MYRSFFLFISLFLILQTQGQEWKKLLKIADNQQDLAKYDVVNLLDSTGVCVSDQGSGSFTIHRIVKIQTPAGALKHRIIKYDYDPLTAFAEFQKVKIYKANGSTKDIDVKTACDYAAPARAIYWGARQIMIEIGRLEPGDVVDYEIAKKGFTYALLASDENEDRFVPPMRGQFYDIVPFWSNDPTLTKIYQVSIPKEKDMQYQFYQGECASSLRFEGNKKVYTFCMYDLRPFEKEPNMVDLFDVAPKLMMSTTPNWEAKSKWFYQVNEDYGSFEPTPEAQKKVDELIKGCKTEMEKISVLTHWVADNMRYSGISMGKGEGYTLHNTKMNFTDRCGVCKDKAALLISMLRMAGFEAYPAMTMAGSRVESIPADHFNHSVAVVKLSNGNYMPLDPTWVPFLRELWSSAEQQQNYLPGIPEGSDLLLTPVSAPENHYFKINAQTSLSPDGTLNGKFIVEAEGQSDGSIRRIFTSGFMNDWKNALEKELLAVSPRALLLSVDYGKDPKNYTAAPIKIEMKFSIPNYAISGKNLLIFKPLVMNNLYNRARSYLRINTTIKERKQGFKDACSRLVLLEETIQLPAGYRMSGENRRDEYNSKVADFAGSLKQENNRLKLNQKLTLKKRVYEAEDWQDFRTAVNLHKSYGTQLIVLEKKQK